MRLIEHYLSLQGEGLHAGRLSYFVRFARCNLRCKWCDSSYTFVAGREVAFARVISAILKSRARYVCLTGGEPLLHQEECRKIVQRLPQHHFDIETGGALPIAALQLSNTSIIMDWKLASSGMADKMLAKNLTLLRPDQDLIKFVTVASPQEKKEIRTLLKNPLLKKIRFSVQPVAGTVLAPLADWVLSLKDPRIQFNLQLHKQIWPTHKRKK